MQAPSTVSLPLVLIALLLSGIGEVECLRAESVVTPAMQYFGGRRIARVPQQTARQYLPAPQPLQLRGSKPFEGMKRSPTISPYLNLDARESELGLPNYYLFVRPLQQQQLSNQAQAANLRKLKQRFRVATAQGIVSNNPNGGVPTTGRSAQFLNTGGYFPSVR